MHSSQSMAPEMFAGSIFDLDPDTEYEARFEMRDPDGVRDGVRALEDVCAYSRAAGLQVIADAKRGDIGSTARAYAAAFLESPNGKAPLADALTVNPYLGRDSIDPYLAVCRRDGAGIFCVVKTSNAGGAEVQDLVLSDGRHVWHQVAELVAEWGADLVGEHGLSSVGAVIGATHPRAVGEARRLLPRAILLLPGVGAQGATPATLTLRSGFTEAVMACVLLRRGCEEAPEHPSERGRWSVSAD